MLDGLLPVTPETLQSLHDEASRLTTILDGVDELTRAQTAALQLHRQRVTLLSLLQGIASRFERTAQEQQISILVSGNQELTAGSTGPFHPDHHQPD